ncbi:MAG TPA: NADH-quinone oxidoreductase subunit L, partial [Bacteroidetes bacterium]|nr:NADH-quinone oxidoreductase subunit L [Bacteroidota bacterium]
MNATAVAAVVAQAAPLVACLTILLLLRRRPGLAAGVAIASLVVATVATAFLVAQVAVPNTSSVSQAVWLPIEAGPGLAFGVLLDALSTSMALVVAVITLLVMIYSLGYMRGDPGFARYFGFLALFAWAMLGLVLASNLLQTLVFWELV